MARTYNLKFFKFVCVLIFVVALLQCVSTLYYYASFKVDSSTILYKTSEAFLGVHHSHSSDASSQRNMFQAIEEEVEENEENTEKHDLPVLTFANLFHTLYFKETHNRFFVFQLSNSSVSSIPLHIRNCVYLI